MFVSFSPIPHHLPLVLCARHAFPNHCFQHSSPSFSHFSPSFVSPNNNTGALDAPFLFFFRNLYYTFKAVYLCILLTVKTTRQRNTQKLKKQKTHLIHPLGIHGVSFKDTPHAHPCISPRHGLPAAWNTDSLHPSSVHHEIIARSILLLFLLVLSALLQQQHIFLKKLRNTIYFSSKVKKVWQPPRPLLWPPCGRRWPPPSSAPSSFSCATQSCAHSCASSSRSPSSPGSTPSLW